MKDCESKYNSLFDTGKLLDLLKLSDITLRTEDNCRFESHRYELAKENLYFRSLFTRWTGEDKGDILIRGISGHILSLILIYIYTKKIDITNNNICDLLFASDYLSMDDLLIDIRGNAKDNTTIENCLSILVTSHQIQNVNIYSMTLLFVQIHFREVIDSHDNLLVELPLHVLKDILRRRTFFNTPGDLLWKVINQWVKNNTESRKRYVSYLLCHLAENEISENLAKDILNSEIVKNNPFCNVKDMSQDILDKNPDVPTNLLKFKFNILGTYVKYRIPEKLYVFCKSDCINPARIFFTFDEKPDLWRKMETDIIGGFDTMISVQQHLYFFSKHRNRGVQYNLLDNTSIELLNFNLTNYSDKEKIDFVKLNHVLYVLRSIHKESKFRTSTTLEKFNPETLTWVSCVESISFVNLSIKVVSAFNKIFVFGYDFDIVNIKLKHSFQAYDPHSNTWSNLGLPDISFCNLFDAAFVEYQGELLLLSKEGKVRSFNPFTGEWGEAPFIVGSAEYFEPLDPLALNVCLCLNCKSWNQSRDCYCRFSNSSSQDKRGPWEEVKRLRMDKIWCVIDYESTIRALYRNRDISEYDISGIDI